VIFVFGAIHIAAACCWLGFDPGRPILGNPPDSTGDAEETSSTDHRNPGAET
jgi:hypothetical protein